MVGEIGLPKMQEWVKKTDYGKMDIQAGNLTDFWLKGQSKITPYEQLSFLKKLAKNELPLRPSPYQKINKIMTMMDNNGLVMKAKTGLAFSNGKNIGWFVGIVERKDGEQFIFVNNITCKTGAIREDKFMMARKAIVGEVLKQLGVI
jgi:beta-lactamase class D